MADDGPTQDEAPITFNVKSSSDARYVITLPLTATILDLKRKLAGPNYADVPTDRQRLIYSGRVLKDADALSSYKIKEGNTIHLVKSAASNQRQDPAQAGIGSTTGASQGAVGVPTNLAAGTGRDPLAGLTGARYAGYAQMPNANMFGPDGGMGPPPDPEQMASMLENPGFASQLNEALSNPEVIEQMIRTNPMFQGPMAAQAREMLSDPSFRRMMTDPEMMRNMSNMRRSMPGLFGGTGGSGGGAGGGNQAFPMPGNAESGEAGGDAQQGQVNTGSQQPPANPFEMLGNQGPGAANPFAALFGGMPSGGDGAAPENAPGRENQTGVGQRPGDAGATNPFQAATQMLMQNPQMIQQLMGGMGAANNDTSNTPQAQIPFAPLQAMGGLGRGFGGFGGGSPSPQPPDERPPEVRYEDQLRQLNDMGFYEFERNVQALRRSGGSVQGAVEYLLTNPS